MNNFSFEPLKLKLATNNIIIPLENGVADLTNAETSAKIMLGGKELFPDFDDRIGGRNLYLNSATKYPSTYQAIYTATDHTSEDIPSKNYRRYNNWTPNGGSSSFYFPNYSPTAYSQDFRGKDVTLSFYMRSATPFVLGGPDITGVNVTDVWTRVVIKRNWQTTYNYHLYIREASEYVDISSIQIEYGNKDTSWTPAPEDVLQFATLTSYNCSAAIVDDLVKITSHTPDTTRGWVDVTVNYGNLSNTKRLNWSVEGVEVYKPTGTLLTMNGKGIKL